MNSCKRTLVNRLGTIVLSLVLFFEVSAQTLDATKGDTLPFFKRFSFHTNTIDWVLQSPNIGVEFNFSGTPTSRFSILVNGKYNWNTHHSVQPRIVYNVAAVQVEARKYWRTGGRYEGHSFSKFSRFTDWDSITVRTDNGKDTTVARKPAGYEAKDETVSDPRWFIKRIRRNVFSGRTFRNARMYRAYYGGLYAGYEKYTYSLGRGGIQGDSYNFGVSGGYSIPLYFFRNGHSLDLDLGLALGMKMMEYDKFDYEEETGCYAYTESKSRHFLPYPILQDVRVGFVFRFRSIKDRVQGGAERYELWIDSVYNVRQAKRLEKKRYNENKRDSIYRVREVLRQKEIKKRDSLRLDRQMQDSIEDALREQRRNERKKKKEEDSACLPYIDLEKLIDPNKLWVDRSRDCAYYIRKRKGGAS